MDIQEESVLLENEDNPHISRTSELLAILRAPPVNDPRVWKTTKTSSVPRWQGRLFKQRRNGDWKEFLFALNDGLMLSYAHDVGNKPKRTFPVAFASLTALDAEDSLVAQQIVQSGGRGTTVEFCKTRLTVFAPTRTYVLGGNSDEELEECFSALNKAMSVFSDAEIDAKRAALDELQPLMVLQIEAQRFEQIKLLNVLEQLGLVSESGGSSWFEHQGRLDMLEHKNTETVFSTYYFGIKSGYMLYYHDDSDHKNPAGVISLAAVEARRLPPETTLTSVLEMDRHGTLVEEHDVLGASIERIDDSKHVGFLFKLNTPLRTYILSAPADLLVDDWLKAIRRGSVVGSRQAISDAAASKSHGVKGLLRQASGYKIVGVPDAPADEPEAYVPKSDPNMVFELVYTRMKGNVPKQKRIRIKDRPVQIGRLGTSDIVVKDPHCSRQHARVICKGSDVFVHDLGSRIGTMVNGVSVSSRRLVNGDTIEIGDMSCVFNVRHRDGAMGIGCCVM